MNVPHYLAKNVQITLTDCAYEAHFPLGFGLDLGIEGIVMGFVDLGAVGLGPPLLYISVFPYFVCDCLGLLTHLFASTGSRLLSRTRPSILLRT